jgi:hypothetical protein
VLTYDFRLPPGPRTIEYALLAEELARISHRVLVVMAIADGGRLHKGGDPKPVAG